MGRSPARPVSVTMNSFGSLVKQKGSFCVYSGIFVEFFNVQVDLSLKLSKFKKHKSQSRILFHSETKQKLRLLIFLHRMEQTTKQSKGTNVQCSTFTVERKA